MTRLTRRQAAWGMLANAPLDHDVAIPKKRAKPQRPEAHLHAACAKYLRMREKSGFLRFHSNIPEGKRDPKRAGWFAMMSGRAGFPDIIVMYAPGANAVRTIFIELKSPDGRLSAAQEEWREWLEAAGYEHYVVRSVDQLADILI